MTVSPEHARLQKRFEVACLALGEAQVAVRMLEHRVESMAQTLRSSRRALVPDRLPRDWTPDQG